MKSILQVEDDPNDVFPLRRAMDIVKPVDYDKFSEAIKQLGLFIDLVRYPR